MNYIKAILILSSLSIIGCDAPRNIMEEYGNTTLDVLVTTECKGYIENKLLTLDVENKINVEYRKFIGLEKVYSNIEGYFSLKINENHNMLDLHNFKLELTKDCSPNTEIYFDRNPTGWLQFQEEIQFLESLNIDIHSTKINKNKLSIFIYNSDINKLKEVRNKTT